MGCDIHWWSETRRDGAWACDQAATREIEDEGTDDAHAHIDNFPDRGRDYWLFGLLASGVRTEWPWSFAQKGAPPDASKEVQEQIDGWDSDGHSHNYLTRAELKAKLEELKPERARLLIDPNDRHAEAVPHFLDRLQQIVDNLKGEVPDEDQRIVFFFDN